MESDLIFPDVRSVLDEKGFVEPGAFVDYFSSKGWLPKFKIPKNVIFYLAPGRLPEIFDSKYAPAEKCFQGQMHRFDDEVGVLTNLGMGSANIALYSEIFIALGAERLVIVGTAGAINGRLRPGDIVVCEKAIPDEGVTRHYWGHANIIEASEKLLIAAKKNIEGHGDSKTWFGSTWTTDAFFRETKTEIDYYRNQAVLTVEMECSALYSVARYRKKEALGIFVVSDLLSGPIWEPQLDKLSESLRLALKMGSSLLNH